MLPQGLILLWCANLLGVALGRIAPKVIITPNVPSAYQSSFRFQNNYIAANNAANEAQAAMDRSESSTAMESASRSRMIATRAMVERQNAATLELLKARKMEVMQQKAQAVLDTTNKLLTLIPDITKKAVERAVKDVEQEEFMKMNREVKEVVVAVKNAKGVRKQYAADAAQAAALPYMKGRMQAQQTMLLYVEKAREVATAVAALKSRAMRIASQAPYLQKAGDVVHAQQLEYEAHDLMDKALQLQGQAKAMSAKAVQIQQTLQQYDDAAKVAAAYGAYQADPTALDEEPELPQPPFPLLLPKVVASGAPGPGPAPAPAAAAAAS